MTPRPHFFCAHPHSPRTPPKNRPRPKFSTKHSNPSSPRFAPTGTFKPKRRASGKHLRSARAWLLPTTLVPRTTPDHRFAVPHASGGAVQGGGWARVVRAKSALHAAHCSACSALRRLVEGLRKQLPSCFLPRARSKVSLSDCACRLADCDEQVIRRTGFPAAALADPL